jgi:hypothetical protein
MTTREQNKDPRIREKRGGLIMFLLVPSFKQDQRPHQICVCDRVMEIRTTLMMIANQFTGLDLYFIQTIFVYINCPATWRRSLAWRIPLLRQDAGL